MPAWAQIINYDNDPDLALALKYDAETNGGNLAVADQKAAERHYLQYLSRCKESAQRARVLVQLGVLFNTNWDAQKGETPDHAKARRYFEQALEAEPDRIGRATLRARLGMASSALPPEERLEIRIRNFKWLEGVTEKAIREKWLPESPDTLPTEDKIRAFTKKIQQNIVPAQVTNITYVAMLTKDPVESLNRIIQELPGTVAASAAQQKLVELRKKFEQIERHVTGESISGIEATPRLDELHVDAPRTDGTDQIYGFSSVAQPTGSPSSVPEESRRFAKANKWAPMTIIGIFILTTTLWIIRRTRQGRVSLFRR